MITAASEDQTQEKFKESSKKIYTAYTLSNKDTLYLYYAAYDASRAEDFDNALNYFKKLRNVGYTGKRNYLHCGEIKRLEK